MNDKIYVKVEMLVDDFESVGAAMDALTERIERAEDNLPYGKIIVNEETGEEAKVVVALAPDDAELDLGDDIFSDGTGHGEPGTSFN